EALERHAAVRQGKREQQCSRQCDDCADDRYEKRVPDNVRSCRLREKPGVICKPYEYTIDVLETAPKKQQQRRHREQHQKTSQPCQQQRRRRWQRKRHATHTRSAETPDVSFACDSHAVSPCSHSTITCDDSIISS